MSTKALDHNRDYFLARIARALGCAGYTVDECDAIMTWVQAAHPAGDASAMIACGACLGSGRRAPLSPVQVISAEEQMSGMAEDTRFLVQGICLACRGAAVLERPDA